MAYDEIYNKKHVRPLYRESLQKQALLSVLEKKAALRAAKSHVHNDADFLPLVRLMSAKDYGAVSAGVQQRGRALRLFLMDHYFGGRSYERRKRISKSEIDKILVRHKAASKDFTLSLDNIQFWYAPDLIRDETGAFRVLEDNIGFVGGIGDLSAFKDAMSALGFLLAPKRDPIQFYRRIVQLYKREAKRCGGGKVVLLSHPKAHRWNHEDTRLEKIFAGLGVTSITSFKKLKMRDDGVYHLGDRVGFLIVNVNFSELDPKHSAEDQVARFWQTASKRKIGLSFSPGLDFVGDKAFCRHVEALIEFYLNEKPILTTLKTLRLENSRAFQKLYKERERWVLKRCNGQSGESVWIGKHMSAQAWKQVLGRVQKSPVDFIAQEFCEPSQFLEHAVDLRPLAMISSQGALVSPIPWGRAARTKKSKTNIARGGLLAPVGVL